MTANDPPPPPPSPDQPELEVHDSYRALKNPDFRQYFIGNAFSLVGMQMAGIAIGWELYARTNSATALGLVGLVQIVPIVTLSLPAGHLVDRFNRKTLILIATAALIALFTIMGFSSRFAAAIPHNALIDSANAALLAIAHAFGESKVHFDDPHIPILFALLLLIGAVRSINQPAKQTIMPMLVSPQDFPNAVTWNSSLFETSNMIGPTIAGFAIALLQGPDVRHSWAYAAMYWASAGAQLVQFINFTFIHVHHPPRPREPLTLRTLLAGVHFVASNRVILGVITLDLFAVLLGGATALLPLFAKDILHVGPAGLGWLRAAPSIGALTMAMIQAHAPPTKNAGRNLVWAVAGFGAATIVFGFSTSFILSMIALVFTGLFDNISVVTRHTLIQLRTPDEMRGRVNAVNSVFISCSNELGGFESGATAAVGIRFLGPALGPMTAVAAGGLGTILTVAAVATFWPEVRRVKSLTPAAPPAPLGFSIEPDRVTANPPETP